MITYAAINYKLSSLFTRGIGIILVQVEMVDISWSACRERERGHILDGPHYICFFVWNSQEGKGHGI